MKTSCLHTSLEGDIRHHGLESERVRFVADVDLGTENCDSFVESCTCRLSGLANIKRKRRVFGTHRGRSGRDARSRQDSTGCAVCRPRGRAECEGTRRRRALSREPSRRGGAGSGASYGERSRLKPAQDPSVPSPDPMTRLYGIETMTCARQLIYNARLQLRKRGEDPITSPTNR